MRLTHYAPWGTQITIGAAAFAAFMLLAANARSMPEWVPLEDTKKDGAPATDDPDFVDDDERKQSPRPVHLTSSSEW